MAKPSSMQDAFVQFLGADWFNTPAPRVPQMQPRSRSTALAQYLLTHNKPGPTLKLSNYTKEGAASEEPSFLNRAFDFLDQFTGARAARNTAYAIADQDEDAGFLENLGDQMGDIGKAVAGNVLGFANDTLLRPTELIDKLPGVGSPVAGMRDEIDNLSDRLNPDIRGSKILERTGVENKYAKGIGGFLTEVALDPGWAIPGLGFAKLHKTPVNTDSWLNKAAAQSDSAPNPSLFQAAQKPKFKLPALGELAMRGGTTTSREFTPQVPRVSVAPTTPTDDFSWGAGDAVMRILNDPDSMAEMKKMKKSDDGWRAAQKRWGRDPDVEQAHLDSAVSKAAWYERMQQSKLAKKGKITDGKGNISQISVARVLEDIEKGNIPRWGPEPASATGVARDIAIEEADNHLTSMLGKSRTDFNPANQANLYNRLFNATEDIIKSDPELAKKFSTKKDGLNLKSPRARQARRVMARAMLRTAEDHLVRLGKTPQYWDGTGVRLSNVLEEIGLEANDELATSVLKAWQTKNMDSIKEPAVKEAITRALARRPLHLSGLLEDAGRRAEELKAQILDNYTYPKAQEKLSELPDYAKEMASKAGLTTDEMEAVKKLVANIVDVDKIAPEKFLTVMAARLSEAVKAGRVDADTLYKLNKEITKVLGQTKKELMTNITGHKVVDGFMTRFSTFYGRIPEMKRFSQDVMVWGERNAEMRAEWLRRMVQATGGDQEKLYAAFKVAQGMADTKAFPDPVVGELSAKITDYFETMLGSSGISKLMQGHTVATKSQIVMDDVNKQLKAVGSNFQFTNKAGVKDQFLGLTHDFSATGEGWVSSWKLANPKGAKQDPVSFLYDLDLAIERTVKEYTLIDEFGRSFGFRKGEAGFNSKIHTARLKSNRLPHDVFFTPEHRDMMQRLLNDIDEGLWRPNSKLMQHYSRGLRVWKTGVTIYAPSHHIRNLIGDLHLMWWAGHNDPRNFIRAAKVLHAQRTRYKEAMESDTLQLLTKQFTDPEAAEWAKASGSDTIIRKNGFNISADQIYVAAHQHGLLLDANKYEDIFGQAPLENLPGSGKLPIGLQKRIAEPLGGKAHHVAAKVVAENREHYVRLAHYVGAINKRLKKGGDLNKILQDAAHEVRKWHPDGRDLTQFEQKARFAIPFYSWTRKAIPLIVQSAVTRPSKVMYYPRAQMALGEMLGVQEDPTMLDPFPNNQLFPEWIRARGIGPVFDPQSENDFAAFFGKFGRNSINMEGEESGYVVANPSNPFNDVVEQIAGFGGSPLEIGKSAFDSSTPALKIPGELAFDQTFSGAPISADKPGGKGVANYLINQIPIFSMGNNVAEFEFGNQKVPEGREPGRDTQALINYLTALGLRGTGPYEKTAEFEASDRARTNGK